MPCRRGYGLPRRFAPRNDRRKFASCPRLPGGTAGKRSCTRRNASVFSMSLRTSAHTCGNPRPRRGTWQVGSTSGKFVALFRICLRHCSLVRAAARRTDCHVASLLAMTGENLLRVRVCQEVLPESVLAPADTPLSSACLQCKDARPGANLRRALPSACRNWAGQPESGHGYPGDMPPGSPNYRRKAGKPYGKHRRYVETD